MPDSIIAVLTIYVRKEEEKVYNALMLEDLSVAELKSAVSLQSVFLL